MAGLRLRSTLAAQLALLAVLLVPLAAGKADPRVDRLAELRSASRDGLIKLTEDSFKEFIVGTSRPYTVIILFMANQLIEANPSLQLPELRKEFGYAAKAFAAGPSPDRIFFFESLLEDSSAPFQMFQINSLPYAVRIQPEQHVTRPPVELKRGDKMSPDTISQSKYPWSAETIVEFLSTKDITAGEVNRPSFRKSPLFPVAVLLALVVGGVTAYQAYHSAVVKNPTVWAAGAVAVFWWSVGGGMYNIIRGMPLFIRNREGRIQFFLGRGGSLGAEGMIMGATYVGFSVSLALITYAFPRIKNTAIRTLLSYAASAISLFCIYQTFTLWQAKTGYGIRSYLF